MRILIVEDERTWRAVIQRGLEAQGYQAPIAETGEDAILLVRAEPVDLVLLDIALPDFDGHAVLAELGECAAISRSSWSRPATTWAARSARSTRGADDYITKPFNFDELLARIRALTRRADQAQAAAIVWEGCASISSRTASGATSRKFPSRGGSSRCSSTSRAIPAASLAPANPGRGLGLRL